MREYFEAVWEAIPEGLTPPHASSRLEFLLTHLPPRGRLLDLGCGEGWFTRALSDAQFEVVGADVAEEPLRRARRVRSDLDLRLIEGAGDWPLGDAELDAVWAGEVIEHVHDTSAWLSEVRRVLRPGGTLLLSTPAHDRLTVAALALVPGAFESHFDPCSDHLRFYTRRSLRELLQAFRFEQVRIRGVGGFPGARACLLACARRARF